MHLYTGKIDGAETTTPVFSEEDENGGIKIYSEYSQFLIHLLFTYFMEHNLNVNKNVAPFNPRAYNLNVQHIIRYIKIICIVLR